jgi:ribose transport system substrate-binding protein
MKKARKIVAIVLVLLMVFAFTMLAACNNNKGGSDSASSGGSSSSSDSGSSGGGGGGETVSGTLASMIDPNDVYSVVCCIDSIEYWNAHRYAWQEAGRLWGVKTTWEGMIGDDVTEMVTLFDSVAAKSPAGMVVLGWDEGLGPSIDKAVAAGIPVVCFSGDVTSNRNTWTGSDNHDIGYFGGKAYAESIGGKGKVAILTYPGKGLFDGRQKGFEAAFAEYPGIDVVAIGNTQTDEAIAVQAAKDILTANPDLQGFVCCDATGPNGAATAIEEAGLTGKVDVLGLDRDTAMLERIKAGTVTGAVVQNDANMLYWGMLVLLANNYYGDAMLTTNNDAAGVKLSPDKISCSINYIDKSNVDLYIAANEIYLQNYQSSGITLQEQIDTNDTYSVVCCIDSIEYWNAHRYAWKEAGKLYGVNTAWEGMIGDDVTEMVTLFDSVAAKSPAGMVVLGWDEGLGPSIDKAVASGIPVVCFSGDVTSNRNTWVGSDNHDIGYFGGKAYAESIGGKGKVAILSYPGKGLFDERQKGFEDAFSEFPGIELVAVGNTQTDEAIAVQAAKDILAANPDLKGFVCCDATGPNGAATAIEEAGLTGKVDVLGLDRDTAMLERIKAGTVTGAVVQDDATMLFWGMSSLIAAKYYDPVVMLTTDNKAAGAVLSPNKIRCAINYINADNVDWYMEANEIYLKNQ